MSELDSKHFFVSLNSWAKTSNGCVFYLKLYTPISVFEILVLIYELIQLNLNYLKMLQMIEDDESEANEFRGPVKNFEWSHIYFIF